MKLIVCVSENKGIGFNNRRQSRDEQVCRDMLVVSNGDIFMTKYSAKLFEGIADVQICEDCRELDDCYFFAEKEMPDVEEKEISQVVLYHWNRDYPADCFFDMDLKEFRLKETEEFAGKSHERIRREIWERLEEK